MQEKGVWKCQVSLPRPQASPEHSQRVFQMTFVCFRFGKTWTKPSQLCLSGIHVRSILLLLQTMEFSPPSCYCFRPRHFLSLRGLRERFILPRQGIFNLQLINPLGMCERQEREGEQTRGFFSSLEMPQAPTEEERHQTLGTLQSTDPKMLRSTIRE